MFIFLLILAAIIAVLVVPSVMLENAYNHYMSDHYNSMGLTGLDIAEILCKRLRLDIDITISGHGPSNNYYNSLNKTINLSEDVAENKSVTSIAIVSHEIGHVLQYRDNYVPITMRDELYSIASWGIKVGVLLLVLGIVWKFIGFIGFLLLLGLVAYFLFTIPSEYDASNRGVELLRDNFRFTQTELDDVRLLLKYAARTYISSFLASSLASVLNVIDNNDEY